MFNDLVNDAKKWGAEEICRESGSVELLGNQERSLIIDMSQQQQKMFGDLNAILKKEARKVNLSIRDMFHFGAVIDDDEGEAICVIGIGETPPNVSLFTKTMS